MNCVTETHFHFPGQTGFYRGKVRDVYQIEGNLLIMIATDRISAFDVVLPVGIPRKGQILNQIASYFLDSTADIVPNWKFACPDPMVTAGRACKPFKIEMVVRGLLVGHAWRQYQQGNRMLCGNVLPDGLKENDPLPKPIITPTTKAHAGHDEDIAPSEIIQQGLVSASEYAQLEHFSLKLFERGNQLAAQKNLILADTKYEFGKFEDSILLIDEIHTPDSSRYFLAEGYSQRQAAGEPQKQLSKEFVRKWLMENGFSGKEGQTIPHIPTNFQWEVSARYLELMELLTGKTIVAATDADPLKRIEQNCLAFLNEVGVG